MTKLWAIYVPGPDEFCAAPSEAIATQMAAKHNAAMAVWHSKHPDTTGLGPSIESTTAVVELWPSDEESHTKAIKDFDYAAWGLEGGAA